MSAADTQNPPAKGSTQVVIQEEVPIYSPLANVSHILDLKIH